MRQHSAWCKCVAFCVGRYVESTIPPHTERYALTPSVMLSDFNKELTNPLKMI